MMCHPVQPGIGRGTVMVYLEEDKNFYDVLIRGTLETYELLGNVLTQALYRLPEIQNPYLSFEHCRANILISYH